MQQTTRPRRTAAAAAPAGVKSTTARRIPRVQLGDVGYLWALVALELAATAFLRHKFRSAHGG